MDSCCYFLSPGGFSGLFHSFEPNSVKGKIDYCKAERRAKVLVKAWLPSVFISTYMSICFIVKKYMFSFSRRQRLSSLSVSVDHNFLAKWTRSAAMQRPQTSCFFLPQYTKMCNAQTRVLRFGKRTNVSFIIFHLKCPISKGGQELCLVLMC